jgi:hypothetical protein
MTYRAIRAIRKTGKTPQVHQSCHYNRPIFPVAVRPEVWGMRWKSVALAAALGPALAGCNIAHNTARNIVNEPHVVWTQHAIEHDLRKAAKTAWESAKAECSEHAASAEFRDGFRDGYVDYLDRGGNPTLPAVPPAKYTRHKKYFTENGQCRVKEYFLGFKLGQEVAIATGRRQFLTVPVLLPQVPPGPPVLNVQPDTTTPPLMTPPMTPPKPPAGTEPPVSSGKAVPGVVVPPPSVPPPLPTPPRLLPNDPAAKPVPLPEPDRLPIPIPVPVPTAVPVPLPVPTPVPTPVLVAPAAGGNLPAIPPLPVPDVPTPTMRTPPIALPSVVLPPNHTVPPPLRPNHPNPRY